MAKSRHTQKWSLNLHEMFFGVKRYYVHGDIVDWLKEILTPLCEEGTVYISEMYHTPIYDDINCIEFYSAIYSSDGHTSLGEIFNDINNLLMYKIPWVSDATYFIDIDKHFNEHLKIVIKILKQFSLWQHLQTTYEMEVNWFQLKRIQVLQFKDLDSNIVIRIDQIFRKVGERLKGNNALYIAAPLPWHAQKYSFRPIDTLCWDICGEEWNRYGLLDEFSLSDLLAIDMANKDFRDPYFDRYIDRYVNLLIARKVPFPTTVDDDTKVECALDKSLDRLWSAGYFLYKFRNKISKVYLPSFYWDPERIKLQDIFNFTTDYDAFYRITLRRHLPDPNYLTEFSSKLRLVHYTLENYRHFSDEMFRKLINLPKNSVQISFDFKKKFEFLIPDDVQPISDSHRFIHIHVKRCAHRNSLKLENFVRYLIKLFKNYKASKIEIDKCKINDYTALANIGGSFTEILFSQMKFSKNDLELIMSYINSKTQLKFYYCNKLGDTSVYDICTTKHFAIENLTVYQNHACTCLVFFMLAEFLMIKNNVQTIRADRLPNIIGLEKLNNKSYEYYLSNSEIRFRYIEYQNGVDIFYFLNDLVDEEPLFDYN